MLDNQDQQLAVFPRSDAPARLLADFQIVEEIDGVPLGTLTLGAVTGLPTPNDAMMYIVSSLVREASADRTDLLVIAEEVRDATGRIVGCRGLATRVTFEP